MKVRKENLPNASDSNHQAYKFGDDLFQAGAFSKAKNAFQEALEFWPEDAQAWLAKGNCYDELNKPSSAEKCFRKAALFARLKDIEVIPYNLANSLFDQERYDEAIGIYEKIAKTGATWPQAKINMALAKRLSSK